MRHAPKWIVLVAVLFFYQNCGQFQPANFNNSSLLSTNPNLETVELGKTLYAQNCASCHSNISESSKIGRNGTQISEAIASIAQMNYLRNQLSAAQIDAIGAALLSEASGGIITEETPEGDLQFQCTAGAFAKTPLFRLSNREFQNSLNDLLDSVATTLKSDAELNRLYGAIPPDRLQVGGAIKEQPHIITQLITTATFDVAYRAGQLVSASTALNNYPGTNSCLSQTTISQTCLRDFVRSLAARAFRRPVTSTEATTLANSLYDSTLSKQNQIIVAFTTIAQSADFLYKAFHRGSPMAGQSQVFELTQHELASKLSYFLTGAPPDAQLRSAADAGQLSDPAIYEAQVDRLINLPAARATVQRLFKESYGYDVFDSFNYASSYLNGISTSGLREAMVAELDDFFVHHVLDQSANFETLLTSRRANVTHSGLRTIYQTSGSGIVELGSERSGFLNRAAFLTKRSGYRASPIKRGLHVLEEVLCAEVGSAPPNAPTALPPVPGGAFVTTRENTERTSQIAGTSCVGCHGRINPLGYPFENFDSLGRYRTEERIFDANGNLLASLPVDVRVTTDEIHSRSIAAADSVELSRQIGQSDKAEMCFVKHLKEFEARVEPTSAANCQMNQALQGLRGDQARPGAVKNSIKNFVMTNEFKYWSF